MIKVLMFEDVIDDLKGIMTLLNIDFFNDELTYDIHMTSQSFSKFDTLKEEYDCVIIDITLAKNSKKDGLSIIETIKNNHKIDIPIIVVTGNEKIKERLKEKGLLVENLRVLYKPIDYIELHTEMKELKIV